jgi:hypothetical protein
MFEENGLLAGTALKPIQIQDLTGGIPQPSANFSYLKGPILGPKFAIYQLGYFFSGARLLDLVQGSSHVFVETGIRVWRLAHLLLPHQKAKLMKAAPVVICPSSSPLIMQAP